ncbi:unnamed protein product [marine sediment metagenome]|uniref:Uncharacterized protein n=1 Tax=marine sediment metagenome TaxID=412755 RepID=X1I6K8_9ZZZZ
MKRGVPNASWLINKKGVLLMGMAAWICGMLGGLCAVMGIITAVEAISEFAELTWMFWLVMSAILLLASIALAVGRGSSEG